jgi:hypothetical protein
MTMYLPEPKTGGDFTPAPEGVHRAVCIAVIDLGTQERPGYQGAPPTKDHMVQLRWELSDELMPDGKFAGQPFTVSKRFKFSTHEKATFRKTLESWRGKKFEASDFGPGGFSIDKLLGAPCMIQVQHDTRDGSTYANIAGIMPLAKGMTKPEATVQPFLLSLDRENYEPEIFEVLGDKLKETIKASPEWQALRLGAPAMKQQADKIVQQTASSLSADLSDEIPF